MQQLDFPLWLRALHFYNLPLITLLRSLGLGHGAWREDYQFYNPEAGI